MDVTDYVKYYTDVVPEFLCNEIINAEDLSFEAST